ncbi:alpha/beta hydrolase [Oscillatoria sp. FACHB-1406]|nr:alpha/beta hydrolase [Oscillatoria sp. FACHB-1406]
MPTWKISTQRATGRRQRLLGRLFAVALALPVCSAGAVIAAERVTLRVGPLQQTVEVEDLEYYAETGELRSSLQFYRPLLSPQVRELLGQRLQVDPSVADTFLNQLLAKPDGKKLLEQLRRALPDSSIEQLRAALYLTLRQANGLSVLSFLRAYPQENLTVDASAAVGIILQLNASNLQSQMLSPMLERELSVTRSRSLQPLPDFDPRSDGTQQVQQRSLVFYDRDRKREIPVDLYYASETRGPLIVFSHGFAADRNFLNYLAYHLASYGFTVATLDHPGSNIRNIAEISFNLNNPSDLLAGSEFVDRPKDISFLLDALERLNTDGGELGGKLNARETVVIGHSLGGYTALALAGAELNTDELRDFCQNLSPLGRSPADWLQCAAVKLPERNLRLRDSRVVRIIALNPAIGKLFGSKGLEKVEVPTLILSSSEDAITPPIDHQLRPFDRLPGEKYLIAAIGATHMSVTDIGNQNSMVGQSTLVREVMGPESEPVRQLIRGVALAFVSQLTPEADRYRPFLTSDYVQSLSTTKLPLRLTTKLPSTLDPWLQVLANGQRHIASEKSSNKTQKIASLHRASFGSLASFDNLPRCFFSSRSLIPSLQPCKGQLHYIFTSVLSNYPA